MDKIRPLAMPGTHESFLKFFKKESHNQNLSVLDVGAGRGAFTKTLFDMGYNTSACDLFPELFEYDKIECKKVDVTNSFPYKDNSFDIAIAIEISEHILDHEVFFSELNRILKPGGILYLSTPNILSLKSRIRFLFKGFFYSFNPLNMTNYNGLQHVSSMTLDQYNYTAIKNGFIEAKYYIDKKQNSSKLLYIVLFPFLLFYSKLKNIPNLHNQKDLLFGRLLFLKFETKK